MKNEAGSALQETWELWRKCLFGKDPSSIFEQLSHMIWDAALFRLIMECRRLQLMQHPYLPELHIRLHMLIDSTFFQSQVVAIRRLVDTYSLYGNKGVYSLRALINDIEKHRDHLTRETFIALQGLPYDYSQTPGHSDDFIWIDISEAHQQFDKLSDHHPEDRSRFDLIAGDVFQKLHKKIDSCGEIARYVDKHIAHPATPESRDLIKSDDITITKIWDAHKTLYSIAEFLAASLYSHEFSVLALEPPLMFMESDIPFLDLSHTTDLEKAWIMYRAETESWRLNCTDKLWDWLNGP